MAANALRSIVQAFPQKHLRLAFAYGSGVFQQKNHEDTSKKMLDFIFVVDDSAKWHEENVSVHPGHYSSLKYLGPSQIAKVQGIGARVYFNTLIPFQGRIIKYGVISQHDFVNDLMDWETLYVSGRLHKPVKILHKTVGGDIHTALEANVRSAVHTALLLLNDSFKEDEFFLTVTGLSYSGDFRMHIAEDINKVSNIVLPNIEKFRSMYETILDNEEHVYWDKTNGIMEQSVNHVSRFHHLNLLPKCVLQNIMTNCNRDGRFRDFEEVVDKVAHSSDCSDVVQDSIRSIVWKSSLTQSLKGFSTAGVKKSIMYSWEKIKKGMRSKKAQ